MTDPTGFLQYPRLDAGYRPVEERIRDWREVDRVLAESVLRQQAARCMDCGIPFCHGIGCPLKNRIPEFDDLVHRGRWRQAADNLHRTNNFPEITGRVCPALCEAACTLAINDRPVSIKHIEYQIAERALAEGWVVPQPARHKTGKKVAVVGSGPAGLAAAQQLARTGHEVVVFEKDDRIGGLLRYGIPDFKLEKHVIDHRLEQMAAEGVRFETDVTVGQDVSARYLQKLFDAVCLSMGAGRPRPLEVPGAELGGVHFAMEFLAQQNRRIAGDEIEDTNRPVINASGKHVVVIGGGDTGSDCVGTAIRQGALSVHQLEILPQPPDGSNPRTPWPNWPEIMRTSSSQQEGCRRMWSALTTSLSGSGGYVTELCGCQVDWGQHRNGRQMEPRSGTDFKLPADLVLLSLGFLHAVHAGLINAMGLELDRRGNVLARDHMTSIEGVFAAGDIVSGASLVVQAIDAGRQAAAAIDKWLQRT